VSEQARCTVCSAVFAQADVDALPEDQWGRCPRCGTKSLPCDPARDVDVRINWHELRILCMWAERWGLEAEGRGEGGATDVVYAIAGRLKAQHPTQSALTLIDELRGVRKALPGSRVETNHPYDDGGEP